jgi:S1-C subfamily serine protease
MRKIGFFLLIFIVSAFSGAGGSLALIKLKPELFRSPVVVVTADVPLAVVDIRPYVVQVQAGIKDNDEVVRLGQGVAWDAYRIITNAHVVKDTPSTDAVKVLLGGAWVEADRVVWSLNHDVAMIEFSRPHGVPIAGMRGLTPAGEAVFYYNIRESRVLTGRVLSDEDNMVATAGDLFVVSSLPTRKGDSGGPVFDAAGNVLGLATRAASTEQGSPPKSYHLSAQLLRQVMLTLKNYEPSATPPAEEPADG